MANITREFRGKYYKGISWQILKGNLMANITREFHGIYYKVISWQILLGNFMANFTDLILNQFVSTEEPKT